MFSIKSSAVLQRFSYLSAKWPNTSCWDKEYIRRNDTWVRLGFFPCWAQPPHAACMPHITALTSAQRQQGRAALCSKWQTYSREITISDWQQLHVWKWEKFGMRSCNTTYEKRVDISIIITPWVRNKSLLFFFFFFFPNYRAVNQQYIIFIETAYLLMALLHFSLLHLRCHPFIMCSHILPGQFQELFSLSLK